MTQPRFSKEQSEALKMLGLNPDRMVKKIPDNRDDDDQIDWLAITKQAIRSEEEDLLNENHQIITGAKTKQIGKKKLGNRAILREIAGLRQTLNDGLARLHNKVEQLERKLREERRERQMGWLHLLHLLEALDQEAPNNAKLMGWLMGHIESGTFNAKWLAGQLAEGAIAELMKNHKPKPAPVKPLPTDDVPDEVWHGPDTEMHQLARQAIDNANKEILKNTVKPFVQPKSPWLRASVTSAKK